MPRVRRAFLPLYFIPDSTDSSPFTVCSIMAGVPAGVADTLRALLTQAAESHGEPVQKLQIYVQNPSE